MRKLALPVLAACALLAVSAPAANAISVSGVMKIVTAAIKPIQDINAGQTAAINGVDKRVDTVVGDLAGVSAKVNAIIAGVPQITDGLKALKDGLTTLAAGVQGPGVAGQLGAAGTSLPGAANAATPSTLPTGTVYRQIVLASGPPAAGAPIGARTWIKLPELAATGYTNNSWVCTSGGATGVFGGTYNAQAACPSASFTS